MAEFSNFIQSLWSLDLYRQFQRLITKVLSKLQPKVSVEHRLGRFCPWPPVLEFRPKRYLLLASGTIKPKFIAEESQLGYSVIVGSVDIRLYGMLEKLMELVHLATSPETRIAFKVFLQCRFVMLLLEVRK